MMQWITPKTDWKVKNDKEGRYIGDYFETEDYNRIKNNLQFLNELASKLYPEFEIADMGADKSEEEYPYADEINRMEENLVKISENTYGSDYGNVPSFMDNAAFIDFKELNRIEGATLDMYNKLSGQYEGRRMLTFMLGSREVL